MEGEYFFYSCYTSINHYFIKRLKYAFSLEQIITLHEYQAKRRALLMIHDHIYIPYVYTQKLNFAHLHWQLHSSPTRELRQPSCLRPFYLRHP